MAFTFIMQNIAANLGGMLTPFGNPQNLYLYTKFQIPTGEFMGIMAIPFVLAVALITVCCLFMPKEPLTMRETVSGKLPAKRTALYLYGKRARNPNVVPVSGSGRQNAPRRYERGGNVQRVYFHLNDGDRKGTPCISRMLRVFEDFAR